MLLVYFIPHSIWSNMASNNDNGFTTVQKPSRNNRPPSANANPLSKGGYGGGYHNKRDANQGQDTGKRTPRKETDEERKNRQVKEKYQKDHKNFEDFIKETSETEVKMAFRTKISEITPEKIIEIYATVLRACEKRDYQSIGVKKEELPLKVRATVMGRIVKHIPLMGTGFCPYIERLAGLIKDIISEQQSKLTDYNFLNLFSWPEYPKDTSYSNNEEEKERKKLFDEDRKKKIMSSINLDEYQRAFELFIEIYGCDVRAKNIKGETALQAYEKAVHYGSAPSCDGIRNILNGKISRANLFKMLCNMANAMQSDTAHKFGNTFKLGMLFNMELLVETILNNILKIRPESGQHGFFSQIKELFTTCKIMADTDILHNEWRSVLEEEHKGTYSSKFEEFVNAMNLAAQKKLQDVEDGKFSEEQLMHFTPTVLPGVIVESWIVLKTDLGKVYDDFVSPRLNEIKMLDKKKAVNQSMIIVATSHAVNALNKTKKYELLSILTPQILETMHGLIVQKKIGMFAATQIERIIGNFLEVPVLSRDLDKVSTLLCVQAPVHNETVTVRVKRGKNKKCGKKTKEVKNEETFQSQSQKQEVREEKDFEQDSDSESKRALDLAEYIDLDNFSSKAPRCLSTVTVCTKQGDVWSNEQVDDWVYSHKMVLKKLIADKKLLNSACIPTLVYTVISEIIMPSTPGVEVLEKLELFKLMLEDVYDESCALTLGAFAKSIEADPMKLGALGFESEFNENAFKSFMSLYNITFKS